MGLNVKFAGGGDLSWEHCGFSEYGLAKWKQEYITIQKLIINCFCGFSIDSKSTFMFAKWCYHTVYKVGCRLLAPHKIADEAGELKI